MSKPAKKRALKAVVPRSNTARTAASKPPLQPTAMIANVRKGTGERGSKQSSVIAMLQSPNGTTIAAVMKVTGWQQHSVRGFLAGVVRKRLKLTLDSQRVDGERFYWIPGEDKVGSAQAKQRSA